MKAAIVRSYLIAPEATKRVNITEIVSGHNGVANGALLSWNNQEESRGDLAIGTGCQLPRTQWSLADGFSLTPANGPFDVRHPHDYARLKAANFPNEGGPAVVMIELSDELADILIGPLGQVCAGKALNVGAEVRFEPGGGLEELCAAWPTLQRFITLLKEDEP
jgi:hypothetical protein